MSSSNSIIFYFDFSSPYSYFALNLLKSISKKYHIDLILIPILIGVIFKKDNITIPAYSKTRSEYFLTDFKRSANFYKMPCKLPDPFPFSSLVLQRLYWYIHKNDSESTLSFVSQTFEDIFVKGKSLITFEDCQPLASMYSATNELLTSSPYKRTPFLKTQNAHKAGVFGVPFYFYKNEQFWGVDRIPHLENALINDIVHHS